MATFFKKAAAKAIQRMGYTIIPTRQLAHYPLAEHLRKLFNAFDIDCVLDVGANEGQYHDFLRSRAGYEGNIVSFEPIPDHVKFLRRRAADDGKWFIEGCALGRASGRSMFNVMVNTQFSSFLEPDHSNAGNFGGRNEVKKQVAVEIKTLDEVFPSLQDQLGVKRPYLKLDTQGFDLEVIKGSHEQLKNMLALQTEISIKAIYHDMPNYFETIATLEARNFGISGFFPNNPVTHFLEAIEFDCVMVNKALLS